jgi:hypothetical protein
LEKGIKIPVLLNFEEKKEKIHKNIESFQIIKAKERDGEYPKEDEIKKTEELIEDILKQDNDESKKDDKIKFFNEKYENAVKKGKFKFTGKNEKYSNLILQIEKKHHKKKEISNTNFVDFNTTKEFNKIFKLFHENENIVKNILNKNKK